MNNTDYYKKEFKFVPEMLIIAFPFILLIFFCCCLSINSIKNWCRKKPNPNPNPNVQLEVLHIDEAIRTYSVSSNESITSVSI